MKKKKKKILTKEQKLRATIKDKTQLILSLQTTMKDLKEEIALLKKQKEELRSLAYGDYAQVCYKDAYHEQNVEISVLKDFLAHYKKLDVLRITNEVRSERLD